MLKKKGLLPYGVLLMCHFVFACFVSQTFTLAKTRCKCIVTRKHVFSSFRWQSLMLLKLPFQRYYNMYFRATLITSSLLLVEEILCCPFVVLPSAALVWRLRLTDLPVIISVDRQEMKRLLRCTHTTFLHSNLLNLDCCLITAAL